MKINKIVLYNFNSYEGLNEFDFTCENNSKNIILIGGKNGAGKTSLFTAIKIALYGPLSFGYVGVNPKYIAKIKDCINSRAFQKDVVRSKVQISVSLTVEREIKEYEITREWDYTKQKLDEKYYVKTEDRFLDGQELSYFQNYLQSMIPPDLFEFFLFDGEEVGSIFSTSTYNSYVKNAVYTLCGLDVFEIIRKYTTGYAGKASSKDEEKIYSHYKELRKNADEIDISFADLEAQIASDKNELEKVETELIEIETAFKNAGGITEVERQALMKEFTEAEHTKTESLTKIKMFVEGLMPFIILRDFTGRITEQLDFEEKGEIYYYVQQKLKRQEIKKGERQIFILSLYWAIIELSGQDIPFIIEELDATVRVGDLIDTIEYDYPTFHLSMDCFWCEVASGELKLLEAEAARWLTKEELDSVQWLPADVTLIDKIKSCMS